MAPRSGRVLRIGVILLQLSWLACVRCEMRKSWKVKSDSSSAVEHVLSKQPRFDEPQEADALQTTVAESRTELAEPLTPPTTTTVAEELMSSTVGQPTTVKSRLRSTYVANRTRSAVFNPVRESAKAAPFLEDHEPDIQIDDFSADEADDEEFDGESDDREKKKVKDKQEDEDDKYAEGYQMIDTILEEVKSIAEGEKPTEKEEEADKQNSTGTKQYDFGPVLNMTIDEPNNIVNVKLNDKVLKDIFTGRGAGGGGFGGGSKKMWKYAMPLFILPFLIQSAVVPFMLMTVKLFLFKSFLAGKLAIFLLLLGAFKNFTQKKDKEVYVKDLPERRYEPYTEWPYPYHSEGRPNWAK